MALLPSAATPEVGRLSVFSLVLLRVTMWWRLPMGSAFAHVLTATAAGRCGSPGRPKTVMLHHALRAHFVT